jgi:hypothetical protein
LIRTPFLDEVNDRRLPLQLQRDIPFTTSMMPPTEPRSQLLRTPFSGSSTSENTPSETVWEIGMGPEIGVPKAAEVYLRAAIGRFLAPIEHAREVLGYFPNSFSTHFGE